MAWAAPPGSTTPRMPSSSRPWWWSAPRGSVLRRSSPAPAGWLATRAARRPDRRWPWLRPGYRLSPRRPGTPARLGAGRFRWNNRLRRAARSPARAASSAALTCVAPDRVSQRPCGVGQAVAVKPSSRRVWAAFAAARLAPTITYVCCLCCCCAMAGSGGPGCFVIDDREYGRFGILCQTLDEALVVGLAGLAGRPSPQGRRPHQTWHLEDAWSQMIEPAGDLCAEVQSLLDCQAHRRPRGADDRRAPQCLGVRRPPVL